MNYYRMFYWMTRADDVKGFFDSTSNWFMFFTVISLIVYVILGVCIIDPSVVEDEDSRTSVRYWKKSFGKILAFSMTTLILTWTLYVLCPTKKEMLLIVAGGSTMRFLTTDSSARKLPSEMTNFVVSELKGMAEQAKVDIGINDQKQKILDGVKDMSATELIDKLKSDTSLRNLIFK